MIYIDDRVGSRDLMALLPAGRATLRRMDYGDVAFYGNGPEGVPLPIGIEVKKLPDVLQCIETGRFAGHQLPGLRRTYTVAYLLVEGIWRADAAGMLETLRQGRWVGAGGGMRRWMWRDLWQWLTTMETRGGVRLRMTQSRQETAAALWQLYQWWTEKEWEEHRSGFTFDTHVSLADVPLTRPSLVRRVAAELPGIGWERSKAVAARFPTVVDMAAAPEKEWREIDGIGKGIATKVVAALQGRK